MDLFAEAANGGVLDMDTKRFHITSKAISLNHTTDCWSQTDKHKAARKTAAFVRAIAAPQGLRVVVGPEIVDFYTYRHKTLTSVLISAERTS